MNTTTIRHLEFWSPDSYPQGHGCTWDDIPVAFDLAEEESVCHVEQLTRTGQGFDGRQAGIRVWIQSLRTIHPN